ncbi:hypothetical protein Tter_1770 [Thermobaculum terrenum ATCC BAA-798]|uniref:Uncharacterized protein n=1 Tax=Thermobaculum terrenum (strain ATCC BAA-798 / CCMEE 7001 / YNP1) TaxID=525904 RepID=D1CD11_THET1|nr:hypothetical protein [Thermobaculum terrenum]ACZ42676.1 hypothetical protein Tter_1770 [Thermobaculum terrenum ATCC BAA-798]
MSNTGDPVNPSVEEVQLRLREAVERYRQAVVASHPDIVPELVEGQTIEEIDASLEVARAAYQRTVERARQSSVQSLPASNPARSASPPADVRSAPAIAKIAWALGRRRG